MFRKIIGFIVFTLFIGLVGVGFAVVGALLGTFVLAGNNSTGFADLGLAILGIIVGYPLGVIIGLILVGKVFMRRGSLWLGILGAIIGAAAVILLAEPLKLNTNTSLLFVSFVIIVPAFTMLGFKLKR